MKKVTALFLVMIVLLQMNTVFVKAESTGDRRMVITISNIDTAPLFNDTRRFSTEIRINGKATTDIKIVSEKWLRPEEFIISVKDIPLDAGKYSYQLMIRSDGTLNFNNDLEIFYQGIDGRYRLDYTIDETDDHLMNVTGMFENIITASPALDRLPARTRDWVVTNFSEDSYSYELDLKTKEGFTLSNELRFLFDSRPNVFSMSYMYDLLNDQHALKVNGSIGSELAYFGDLVIGKGFKADLADLDLDRIEVMNKDLLAQIRAINDAIPDFSRDEFIQKAGQLVGAAQAINEDLFGKDKLNELQNRLGNLFGNLRH